VKIACITTSTIPSDTANSIQVMKVCQALAQADHEISLFTPGQTRVGWDTLAGHYGLQTQFSIFWIPEWTVFKRYDFAIKAVNQAHRWRADLIYTWTPQAALYSAVLGLPVVLEMHDRPTGKLGPQILRWFVRQKGLKRLVVITQALRRALEQDCNRQFRSGEVVIAPNGIDLERYRDLPDPQEARVELGLEEGVTVGYTGHFYPGRGTELLYSLAERLPGVNFLWVGGRPADVTYWRQKVSETGLANIRLVGFVENKLLPMYQAAADVLLMPYEFSIEGSSGGNSADICSPMKMFEYMATGRAIITSDLPVIREVLNEQNAIFCPPQDVEAWQQALQQLLEDEDLRGKLGQRAQNDVRNYTWLERARRSLEGMIVSR
jgi:glycosyltransferase involved in cell wall biosynthesis